MRIPFEDTGNVREVSLSAARAPLESPRGRGTCCSKDRAGFEFEGPIHVPARSENDEYKFAGFTDESAQITYDPAKTNPDAMANTLTRRAPFKAEPQKREEQPDNLPC